MSFIVDALTIEHRKKLTFEALRKANARRGIEWMGGPNTLDDILFTAVELGGESGEVLNAVKKLHRFLTKKRGGVPYKTSRKAIEEELADVIICADRVAETLNIDLGNAVQNKFNKTSKKYKLKTRLICPCSDGGEHDEIMREVGH